MAKTNIRGTQIADASVDLTVDVTGILPTANGGTGQNSLTGLPLTTPKIDAIKDTNGNAALDITATASAVNRFRIDNNATGIGPVISAVGPDTNLDFTLIPQGAGVFVLYWPTTGVTPTIFGVSNEANTPLNLRSNGGAVTANGVDILAGSKLVQDTAYTLAAGYGKYFPESAEISAGIAFEIGSGSVMEIG